MREEAAVFSCVTDFLIKWIIENEIVYKCP